MVQQRGKDYGTEHVEGSLRTNIGILRRPQMIVIPVNVGPAQCHQARQSLAYMDYSDILDNTELELLCFVFVLDIDPCRS